MDDALEKNLAVIRERWPSIESKLVQASAENSDLKVELCDGPEPTLLVNGIQLTSRYDHSKEANDIISEISLSSPKITVYGIGFGALQQEALSRKQLTELEVVLINGGLSLLLLSLVDHTQWLGDARVKLSMATDDSELQSPYAVYPSERTLVDIDGSKIRDQIIYHKETSRVNEHFAEENDFRLQRFKANQRFFDIDADVSELYSVIGNRRAAVVAGSGPSLQEALSKETIERSKQDELCLIAVDTAVRAIMALGLKPDVIVTLDSKISTHHLETQELVGTPLVYFPYTDPSLLDSWKGPRYLANFENLLMLRRSQVSLPNTMLFSAGSVVHPATDLAIKAGFKTIYFAGTDFSFPFGKTHAGWNDGVLGPAFEEQSEWTANRFGEKVPTIRNFLSFLTALESYIKRHPDVDFVNCNDHGAVISGARYL